MRFRCCIPQHPPTFCLRLLMAGSLGAGPLGLASPSRRSWNRPRITSWSSNSSHKYLQRHKVAEFCTGLRICSLPQHVETCVPGLFRGCFWDEGGLSHNPGRLESMSVLPYSSPGALHCLWALYM